MPSIFRISRPGDHDGLHVDSSDAVERAVRSRPPGRYHIDEISADPLPSGHPVRRWGIAIHRPDGVVEVEPDPWES